MNPARWSIADALGTLGEKSIVPDLLALLSNEQLSEGLRRSIAGALGELPQDELIVQFLVRLLATSDIPDVVYQLLWTTSRRIGVRIIPTPGTEGVQFAVVKW